MKLTLIIIGSALGLFVLAMIIDCTLGTRTPPFSAWIVQKNFTDGYTDIVTTYQDDGNGHQIAVITPEYHPPEWSVDISSSNKIFSASVNEGLWDSLADGERVSATARIGRFSQTAYLVKVRKITGTENP